MATTPATVPAAASRQSSWALSWLHSSSAAVGTMA